ncbi:MAG: gamma-glutamyltransferase family protein, partial [Bryobacteraceae bacterium]
MIRRSELSRRSLLAGAPALGAAPKMTEGTDIVVSNAALASEPELAVRAGARILEAGGNAFDAAAATALATGVLQQELCGLGGYVAAAVGIDGKTGRVWSIDANSVAPAAARADMFRARPKTAGAAGINENEYGVSVEDNANVHGPLAVGVPGQLAGIGAVHERGGKLKWAEVVRPTQELVAGGFRFGNTARSIANQRAALGRFPATAEYLMASGTPPGADDVWRPRDLEGTLRRIADHGWRDLYQGELGRRIADHVQALGGILTRDDMARFEPRTSEPYRGVYHGATVYACPLANGGLTVIEALHMLDGFDPLPASDARYWHRLAEVLKLAWRDRLRYFGDSAPVEKFLSKEYAAGRVERLRQFPGHVDKLPGPPAGTSPGTTHISAGDRDGNLVALTLSHGGLFGSCLTVPGTGIILGHGMCRFDPRPGLPNSPGPRKRPLNNVCPTILRQPGRDVALGLRGGRRIVSVATQLAMRVIDHALAPAQAATAPRLHVEEHEPVEITDASLGERLTAMGHQ